MFPVSLASELCSGSVWAREVAREYTVREYSFECHQPSLLTILLYESVFGGSTFLDLGFELCYSNHGLTGPKACVAKEPRV